MWGVLTLAILLWSFGSPGGLPSPHFGSVNVILTLFQKWGCDNQFDSGPLKVSNLPHSLMRSWRGTYQWKALDKGYNFALDFISIGGLHKKLRAPKVAESQLREFRDSQMGVPKQNAIWMLVPWPSIEYTIRGKVVASPKFEPCGILWVQVQLWFIVAPNVFQLCTNKLVFGFVQVRVMLVILPSPVPKFQHTLLPPKCYEPWTVPWLLTLPLFLL
jgi:hypothetical protein